MDEHMDLPESPDLADLAALRTLLAACQELRGLIRDAQLARSVQAREFATTRAEHQWRTVVCLLETLALNEPAPGQALAQRLAQLTAERDELRAALRQARTPAADGHP